MVKDECAIKGRVLYPKDVFGLQKHESAVASNVVLIANAIKANSWENQNLVFVLFSNKK